jgi:hypothetical protein
MKIKMNSIGIKIALFFSLILVTVCASSRAELVLEEKGNLQGKVTIGPLCPVEPCNLSSEQMSKIYEARKVIVYERRTKIKIAKVDLNVDGEYSIALRPGTYIVDVTDSKGNELPLEKPRLGVGNVRSPREIEIRAGEKLAIHFHIDTGIR